jgi:hypothetical protein
MGLEQNCILVLTRQMGPAAKNFLERQCRAHLNKEPVQLQKADLDELARWSEIGTQLILGKIIGEKVKQGLLALK